jgi:phospholipid-transporting ATPase
MTREAFEDCYRYRSDKQTNAAMTLSLVNGKYKNVKAEEVKVGDVILVHSGETFPADLVMLASSN